MRFTALDLVTCAGNLCFGSEEEYSYSNFDENSNYSDEHDEEGDKAAAPDELIIGSEDDEKEGSGNAAGGTNKTGKNDGSFQATTGKFSAHKNEHDARPTSGEEQQVGKAKAAATTADDIDKGPVNGNCDVSKIAAAKNLDAVDGKDDGTVDTALDVTQDVSASEQDDDDESADVEPADVEIDLDGDDDDINTDIDAFVLDLEGEFAPKKVRDEVTDESSKTETEEEPKEEEEDDDDDNDDDNNTDDEKSVADSTNRNESEVYAGKTDDHHPHIHLVVYTPQQQKWNVRYADLLRYYKLYGTSNIPLSAKTKLKHILLRRWADKQRKAYLKGNLTEEQMEKLAAVHALDLLEV